MRGDPLPAGAAAPPRSQPSRLSPPAPSKAKAKASDPDEPPSPYPKCELLPRLMARVFDLMVCGALIVLMHQAGAAAGALYLLLADGLFRGQSLGKRMLGVRVVHVRTRRGVGARQSAVRNFPMAVLGLLALGPASHWKLLAAFSLAVLGYEAVRIWMHPLGLRIGDELAGTQVVDGKIPLATPALAGVGPHRAPGEPAPHRPAHRHPECPPRPRAFGA